MPILYGLKTCDTCRTAAKELERAGRTVTFRDVRADPLDDGTISRFLAAFGETLINRRSATWRGLPEGDRGKADADLLAAYPALMKRPVIEDGDVLTLGWDKSFVKRHLG